MEHLLSDAASRLASASTNLENIETWTGHKFPSDLPSKPTPETEDPAWAALAGASIQVAFLAMGILGIFALLVVTGKAFDYMLEAYTFAIVSVSLSCLTIGLLAGWALAFRTRLPERSER